jgi:Secretion system C-terminal sorting domain
MVAANTASTINALVTVSFPAFLGDVDMFYRLKKSGAAAPTDTLQLSPVSAGNYTVNFPAKPAGEIYEYYFVVYDNSPSPVASAIAPRDARFTILALQRNIPYYIMFGMQTILKEDFETGATGWTFTLPTDNATAGKWTLAKPIGSQTNGEQVQTAADHTTGSGKCAVTGNATSATSPAGNADVDGGRTSVQSPVFNLTGYKNPVVSYWRWFSNSQSSNNPGKDLWKVFISDNGGTSYTLYADRTYVPDVAWRRQVVRLRDVKSNIDLSKVRFLFVALDSSINGGSGTLIEAAVDDFEIYDAAFPASITEQTLTADVYPNPAENIINIDLANNVNKLHISLFDATGKMVFDNQLSNVNGSSISTQNISSGLYFLKLDADGQQSNTKITISH